MQEVHLFYSRIIYREDISWKTCSLIPDSNYMSKVDNRNTRKIYEICLKLTIKTPERRQVHLEKAIEIRVDDLLQVIKTNDKFLT